MGSLVSQARLSGSATEVAVVAPGRQYLTFKVGAEMFAISIENIREIIQFTGLTDIPLMPAFLRGVINVRGAVVPVIDLSARFGRAATLATRRTRVVILEIMQGDRQLALGLMVDAVNEVLTVEPHQIEQRPSFGTNMRSDFIEGMINIGEHFIIALDIQQVLAGDELAVLVGGSSGGDAEPAAHG